MITELGKGCREMARIEDFVSFKSKLLGALGASQTPRTVFWPHLNKCLVTAMTSLVYHAQ